MTLGQSLIDVGNTWDRIALVTADVTESERIQISYAWELVEIETVLCNFKGQTHNNGIEKWSKTCTKFHAWEFTQYQRVIFMDSDLLVISSIDDVVSLYSDVDFLAAPESFPPDTFNSGFMVIKPSADGFEKLLELNERVGSVEGGDQSVLNDGLCPNWHYSESNSQCGRIPWIYNVPAELFEKLRAIKLPAVCEMVYGAKPGAAGKATLVLIDILNPKPVDLFGLDKVK